MFKNIKTPANALSPRASFDGDCFSKYFFFDVQLRRNENVIFLSYANITVYCGVKVWQLLSLGIPLVGTAYFPRKKIFLEYCDLCPNSRFSADLELFGDLIYLKLEWGVYNFGSSFCSALYMGHNPGFISIKLPLFQEFSSGTRLANLVWID